MKLLSAAPASAPLAGVADFLFDIGLTPDPLYVGLGTAGILFAIAAGVQALWRHARAKR